MDMKSIKLAFIDCETSGLSPLKHEILEIGVVIADSETFEVYGKLNFKIKPEHIKTADPKALEVNGYTPEEWKDGMTLFQALMFLYSAIEGCTIVGHNVAFDFSFLQVGFEKESCSHHFKVNKYKIDTLSLAWGKIPHDKVQSWSLKTLCAYLGVPVEGKVHRALAGAEACFGVYKKLMQM